jgi:nucleoside-diphosphate-sugar epimerase
VLKHDVVIFGTGKITNSLIKKLILNGKSVLCITNNKFGQIDNSLYRNLNILSYKEILNTRVESEIVVFSWRNKDALYENDNKLLKWFESGMLHTSKSFFFSSASVYKESQFPQSETAQTEKENDKLTLENVIERLISRTSLLHTNLRISNVYGKDMSYGFIGSLFESIRHGNKVKIFKDQNITRDYIHVDNIIGAVEALIEMNVSNKCLNLSTGIGTSIYQILEIFESYGYKFENRLEIPFPFNVKVTSILDCKTLSSIIKWQPNTLPNVINRLLPQIQKEL